MGQSPDTMLNLKVATSNGVVGGPWSLMSNQGPLYFCTNRACKYTPWTERFAQKFSALNSYCISVFINRLFPSQTNTQMQQITGSSVRTDTWNSKDFCSVKTQAEGNPRYPFTEGRHMHSTVHSLPAPWPRDQSSTTEQQRSSEQTPQHRAYWWQPVTKHHNSIYLRKNPCSKASLCSFPQEQAWSILAAHTHCTFPLTARVPPCSFLS